MEKKKINRTNITEHLIEYQLNMIGKTIDVVKNDEKWYENNTITIEQEEEFKKYAIPLLKKIFKFNKSKAESTFGWFILGYGLKTKQ
jgi:uroporphyrinogen-III decarboxylase